MADFAADTKIRIMAALALPITVPSYVEYVERALIDAYNYGGDVIVTTIEGYLTQYEAAQTSLNSEASNSALIQADVLRWSEGQRNAGYQQEMRRLRMLIARMLLLDDLMQNKTNRVSIRRG